VIEEAMPTPTKTTAPAKTAYAHIVLDAKGRPVIEGTRMRVSHLVSAHLA
jgi:uncharacterized protein (DUF433 family)